MTTIQKRSDLKLRVRTRDISGAYIDMSTIDFKVELFTNIIDKLTFSHVVGEQLPDGCTFDNGDLILSIDKPKFEIGNLFVILKARIPNSAFSDGFYDVSTGKRLTGIEVIDDDGSTLIYKGRYNVELMLDYGSGIGSGDGKSAYQIWLDAGNVGTISDFLKSLKGKDGEDGEDGKDGEDGNDGKDGNDGDSAYDIWLSQGNTGSKQDFIDSLKGDSLDAPAAIASHNVSGTAHPDIRTLIDNLEFVKKVTYNATTGDITFTYRDNSTLSVNILVSSLIKDINYDSTTKEIVLTRNDNTTVRISVADLIDVYTGFNGAHIQVTVETGNVIKAVLKAGTVTENELSAELLAKINGKSDDVSAGTTIPQSRVSSAWQPTQNTPITFVESGARTNVASGDTLVTLFGKIRKWFADLGTMAWESTSNYRTITQQTAIDNTKLDGLDAGLNVVITGTGTRRTVSVPGIPLPDRFSSSQNGTGAVGVSSTYDSTKLTKISGDGVLSVDDIIIFANGYQSVVMSVNTGNNTFVAATISQPVATAWGAIGGTIDNQADLVGKLAEKAELNTTLTDAAGDTTLPSTASGTLVSKIQALRNNVKALFSYFTNGIANAAIKLNTARNIIIGGVTRQFDGTADITFTSTDLGFYTKPAGGIPATDMTTGVQASLLKADNSLQSGHNTDPNAHATEFGKKQDKLNRVVKIDTEANAPTQVTDTGGALTIPLNVAITAPAADSTQLSTGTYALLSALQRIVDNIKSLFDTKVNVESGKGLSTNDFDNNYMAFIDFKKGVKTVTSLASLPMDVQTVYVNVGTAQTLSVNTAGVIAGQQVHYLVKNTSATAQTMTIPTASPYLNMSAASVSLPANGNIEINIVYDGNQSLYKIVVLEKA